MGQSLCCLEGIFDLVPAGLGKELPTPKSSGQAKRRRGLLSIAARDYAGKDVSDEFTLQRESIGIGMNLPIMMAIGRDEKQYAVKTCDEEEVEVHLSLDHPHVVKVHRVFGEGRQRQLVMDYLAGGELLDRLSKRGSFSEAEAAGFLRQILSVVSYLHRNGVVHRDLKPDNFMFEAKTSDHLFLIDFGLARFWTPLQGKMTRRCGTRHYLSPEVLHGSYTAQADVWSIGIIAYCLLTGRFLFSGSKEHILEQVSKCKIRYHASFQRRSSAGAKDFVNALLNITPGSRPSASKALRHPWLCGHARAETLTAQAGRVLASRLRWYAHASPLQRLSGSMMALLVPLEDQRELRRQFDVLDADATGALRPCDIAVFFDGGSSLFGCLDMDGDGELAWSEFLAAALPRETRSRDDLISATFGTFDKENEGFITAEGLRTFVGSHHEGIPIDVLINDVGSKCNGAIHRDELAACLQATTPKACPEVFKALDSQPSGTFTEVESCTRSEKSDGETIELPTLLSPCRKRSTLSIA